MPSSLYASFFNEPTSTYVGTLQMVESTNGIDWTSMPTWDNYAGFCRDPSLIKINNVWYISFTGPGSDTFWGLLSSTDTNAPWIALPNVYTTALVGVVHTWAPEWFIDPADSSIHVIVACSTNANSFKLYEQ